MFAAASRVCRAGQVEYGDVQGLQECNFKRIGGRLLLLLFRVVMDSKSPSLCACAGGDFAASRKTQSSERG